MPTLGLDLMAVRLIRNIEKDKQVFRGTTGTGFSKTEPCFLYRWKYGVKIESAASGS
jgi:hypothetical protein